MKRNALAITYIVFVLFLVPVIAFTLREMTGALHFDWEFPYFFTVLFCPLVVLVCSFLITLFSKGYYKMIGGIIGALIVLWFFYFLWGVDGNI